MNVAKVLLVITLQQQQQQQQQLFILTRLFFPVHWGQPCLWPSHSIFLHLNLSQASSLQSPFSLISSLNTSLHLHVSLHYHLPVVSQFNCCIQHNSSLLSTWPNHLQPVLLHDFTNVINCQHVPHTLIAFPFT